MTQEGTYVKTIEEFIYKYLEELVPVSRWAPTILKTIYEEGQKEDGWCHIAYREWKNKGINNWALCKTLEWARSKKLLMEKSEPAKESPTGKNKGNKRKAFKLRLR